MDNIQFVQGDEIQHLEFYIYKAILKYGSTWEQSVLFSLYLRNEELFTSKIYILQIDKKVLFNMRIKHLNFSDRFEDYSPPNFITRNHYIV